MLPVFLDENHDYNGYGYHDNCDDDDDDDDDGGGGGGGDDDADDDDDDDDDDIKAMTNAIKTNISSEEFSHTCNI
jgi:hypothetical protein